MAIRLTITSPWTNWRPSTPTYGCPPCQFINKTPINTTLIGWIQSDLRKTSTFTHQRSRTARIPTTTNAGALAVPWDCGIAAPDRLPLAEQVQAIVLFHIVKLR